MKKILAIFTLAVSIIALSSLVSAVGVDAVYTDDDTISFSTVKELKSGSMYLYFIKEVTPTKTNYYISVLNQVSDKYYPFQKIASIKIGSNNYPLDRVEVMDQIKLLKSLNHNRTFFQLTDNTVKAVISSNPDDQIVLSIPAASRVVINTFNINGRFREDVIKTLSASKEDFSLYDKWGSSRKKNPTPESYIW